MKRETRENKPRENATRPKVPVAVRLQVLTEAGYMCANPRCKHILTLELHHIEWVRDGGGNEPSNLIALCSNCHDLHTHGHVPREALDAWKQMLMLVNGSLDRESLDLLLFMHKFENESSDIKCQWKQWETHKAEERASLEANENTTQRQLREHEQKWEAMRPARGSKGPLRVTGDGLLRLVRLIRTGLVDEGDQDWERSDCLYVYYWEPALTPMGRRIADAFLNGDAKTFRELLAGTDERD